MSEQLVLALDVGGSSIKSALVENGRHILGSVCVDEIQSGASAEEILNQFSQIISSQLATARDVNRIAFAFPGPFDYEQGISLIQNQAKYEALYGVHVATKLKEILNAPTLEMRFRNDAEAAILGEALYGSGVGCSRLIGLTLGTGLGSAFITEGKIITEGDDLPPHGWLYSLPFGAQRADDVFSTRGLRARLRERGIHAGNVASALQNPDEQSLAEVFASFGAELGAFLKPYVLAFRADAVLVTGGIAEAWERFAPPLVRTLPVRVRKGTLGRRAALLGAAALYF
jgi:glucokinase